MRLSNRSVSRLCAKSTKLVSGIAISPFTVKDMGHSKIGSFGSIAFLAVVICIPSLVIAGSDLSTSSSTNPGRFKIYSISKANILGESHTKNNAGVVVTSYTAVPQPQAQPLKIAKPLKVISKVVKTEHHSEIPQKSTQEIYLQKSQKKPKISVSIFEAGMSPDEKPLQEIIIPVVPPPKTLYVSESDVKQDIDAVEEIPQVTPELQLSPFPVQYRIPTLPHQAQAPVAPALLQTPSHPYYSTPQYNFAYQVHDATNGNNHGHSEIRNGNSVHGQYSVLDPDGVLRVVSYTSDPVNGFQATVNRQLPSTSSIIAKRSLLVNRYSPLPYHYAQHYQ